jgi:hypothetical protein
VLWIALDPDVGLDPESGSSRATVLNLVQQSYFNTVSLCTTVVQRVRVRLYREYRSIHTSTHTAHGGGQEQDTDCCCDRPRGGRAQGTAAAAAQAGCLCCCSALPAQPPAVLQSATLGAHHHMPPQLGGMPPGCHCHRWRRHWVAPRVRKRHQVVCRGQRHSL